MTKTILLYRLKENIYTYKVVQKSKSQTFVHIFAKCRPIFNFQFFTGTFCANGNKAATKYTATL